MTSTARICNIDSEITTEELIEHFRSKELSVASGQTRVSLVTGTDGLKTATLTFSDEGTLQRALKLSANDRQLRGRQLGLDDGFDGFTTLSDGNEIE